MIAMFRYSPEDAPLEVGLGEVVEDERFENSAEPTIVVRDVRIYGAYIRPDNGRIETYSEPGRRPHPALTGPANDYTLNIRRHLVISYE